MQGGPEQVVKALNRNLDIDIDDYATFNWKAVADAINILGGIDVEITKSEFYYINAFISETVKATGVASTQLKSAGMNHLDGVQAVAYGRLRLMDTDYARTERQRKVISLAFEKMKKADWATINNIVQTVFPQVATSIEINDLLKIGRNITRYHLTETTGFPSELREKKMGRKGACVIPQTLESNVIELHHFLFGDEEYTPTETVRTISQKNCIRYRRSWHETGRNEGIAEDDRGDDNFHPGSDAGERRGRKPESRERQRRVGERDR